MSRPHVRALTAAGLLGALLLLSACSDSPEKLLAQARDAYEKNDFATATIHIKNALVADVGNDEVRLLFAQVLTAQGDSVGAERELRKLVDSNYKLDVVLPMIVQSLVGQGLADKAIAEFSERNIEDKAGQARLAVALGNAYVSAGKPAEAAQRFDAALAADPANLAAEVGRARLLAGEQKPDEAQAALDKILTANPKLVEALLLKSDVLAGLGKIEEAIAQAKLAEASAPRDKAPLIRLVSLYLSIPKPEEADAVLVRLREIAPNDIRTVYFSGVSALRAGKAVEARDAAAKILRALPSHELALILGATANLRLGAAQQAEGMLVKVVAERKDWLLPRRLLAQSYLMMRDHARALEVLKPVLGDDQKDADLLNMAGQAHMLGADYAKAAEYFARVAAQTPDSAEAKTRLGMARMAAGDDERALVDLEAAASADTKGILAEAALIARHLRKGEGARAMQVLEKVEREQPDNPAVANIRGAILLATRDNAGARKAFERALSLQPENVGAILQLTRLDMADGKPDEARARLQTYFDKNPKNPRAGLMLAQFLVDTNTPPGEVRKVLEKAVEADPSRNEARAALVQVLLRSSDSKAALNVAQQASAAQPDNPEILRLLGRTQLAAGEKLQAVSTFGKLQGLEPENPQTLLELADAQRATEDLVGAERNLSRALEIRPDFPEAAQRLQQVYLTSKRLGEALQVAKRLQKAAPTSAAGFMLEAEALGAEKRWPEALSALENAWSRAKSPHVLFAIRKTLREQGKNAEAQRRVDEYLAANPKDGVVRMQIADEALVAQQYDEALKLYKMLAGLAPNNVVVLNNLAWVANKQSDPKALEYAETALKAAPRVPAVMETVGTVLVERGQSERGLKLIKEAVDLAPKAAAVRLGYARALARTGDKASAKREADKALDGLPAEQPLRAEIEAFRKTL